MIKNGYQCINCEMHDRLEDYATRKVLTSIAYYNEQGNVETTQTRITDFQTENHAEYLITQSGQQIRLDYVVNIFEL